MSLTGFNGANFRHDDDGIDHHWRGEWCEFDSDKGHPEPLRRMVVIRTGRQWQLLPVPDDFNPLGAGMADAEVFLVCRPINDIAIVVVPENAKAGWLPGTVPLADCARAQAASEDADDATVGAVLLMQYGGTTTGYPTRRALTGMFTSYTTLVPNWLRRASP